MIFKDFTCLRKALSPVVKGPFFVDFRNRLKLLIALCVDNQIIV